LKRQLFGTDGIRGLANAYPITPEVAFKLGQAGALLFKSRQRRPRIVIGKDTRVSGDMLEGALLAGISSVGVDVLRVGVLPTPAIAFLTRHYGADAGVVISASHNSFEDNGIKFFSPSGEKLPDAVEARMEKLFFARPKPGQAATHDGVGRVVDEPRAQEAYVQFVLGTVPENLVLKNLHVVVDCGHGATYLTSPEVLRRLGARVTVLHDLPDGRNINEQCGSTYPKAMQEAVVRLGADLGLAHDGDGDRVILADERGALVDGDRMIGLCALHLKAKGELAKDTVVSTVMANLGFQRALEAAGIKVLRTAVGDRYVLEAMKRGHLDLGGEQSGHVIFKRHHATGDGLITALQVIRVMKEQGKLLTELAGFMQEVPQTLVNVRVAKRVDPEAVPAVAKAVAAARKALGREGRVLVRMSGTEPKVRVMVEGPSQDLIARLALSICDALKNPL
jgi:phosphoglucosamine mutase